MPILVVSNVVAAREYLCRELSDGTTLAHEVLKAIDFDSGTFRVAAPAGWNATSPADFRYEIHLQGDEQIATARVVKKFLSAGGNVLLQDTQASPSDQWLRTFEYRSLVSTYASEIYWTLVGPGLAAVPDEEMVSIMHSASFYPFSAFFSTAAKCQNKSHLEDQDLDCVVRTLVGIAVGAFDERSFLIWWRDDLVQFPVESVNSESR